MSLETRDTTYLEHDGAEIPRERIGPYRLVREIGHGGMGTVYLAIRDDDVFHKRVALKLLKRGMDTDAIVRRFRTERQILAGLDHPNIARLLDGGTSDDGRPYLVMEFVEGVPLATYADARHLRVSQKLHLFLDVCAAVQHAHQNLVIHRDLKPANVLVTSEGVPKLLDFGIAKLLNPEMAGHTMAPTAPGSQLMTPEYASPEQVRGEMVTTASDVYSLGVLLYEYLTGRLPYRLASRTLSEVMRIVCEEDPLLPSAAVTRPLALASASAEGTVAPTTSARPEPGHTPQRLQRRLEGDLDNIVLKALSKEPARRYASVDQLADDIRRHLSGLPVLARPDTFRYRASKFVRRHRASVSAAIAVVLALVVGLVGVAWQGQVARRERQRAEQRFSDVRALANAFLFDVHDAVKDLAGSTPARQLIVQKGLEYLDKLAKDAGDRPELRRELAAGYLRVGDVQGRPLNPNLGDTAGALANYRKAVALYDTLGLTPASPPSLRSEAGIALLHLSEALAATGDSRGAMDAVTRAMELQRDVARDASATPGARRDLASTYSRLGDMLASLGENSKALEAHRMALGIMEQVSATAPDDPANLRQLGIAYNKIGNVLGNPNYPNLGDHASAIEPMRKSVETFARASARYPDNAMFKRNLAVAHSNAADILVALGKRQEANAEEALARATYEAQVREDPSNAAAQNDLAIAFYKQAEMYDAEGALEPALEAIERASAIQDRLAEASPESSKARGEVATNLGARGRILAKLGRRAAAMSSFDRSLRLFRELADGNPDNVERKVYLAMAIIERGDASRVLEAKPGGSAADRAAAVRDYTEAEAILSALEAKGAIQGTDRDLLADVRKKLQDLQP